MSFSVCKLFCCFLTGWIEGTILLAIMNSLLRCLHDLATELIVGKMMHKFDKQCKFYILGQGSTYLFIYLFIIFYTFVKLYGCQCIWDLKSEEYWEQCDQLSDTLVIVRTTLILICLLDAFLPLPLSSRGMNRYTDSVTHYILLFQNVSLNATHAGA